MRFAFRKESRRQQLVAEPFPEQWLPYLQQNIFLYRLLSEPEKLKLRNALRIFIAEKFWEGCAGLQITDEMRVTIAGQACILLLGFDGYYFDELKTVLLYLGGYLGVVSDPLGKEDQVHYRLGEAHLAGPVVLSWWDVCWDGRRLGRRNVVLHEFAHKLAELRDPAADHDPNLAERWEKVMSAEYQKLVEDARYQRPTLLDHYGARNQAEFFAVASESFFLQAIALRQRHPQLHQILAEWYRQDPAERRIDEKIATQAEDAENEYDRHVIAECSTSIRLRPDYPEVYRQRAACYCNLGEFDKALADCSTVIRLAADHEKADANYERGIVHHQAGSYALAIADYDEAIRLAPDFAQAFCQRGSAHAATGEYEQALADLSRALQFDPNDDIAYSERGLVYYDRKKYEKAIRDFTRAIGLAPQVAPNYCNRALARIDNEDYEQAIEDCDEAIQLDPHQPEPYKHRGVARFFKGDHDQAISDLGKAIEIDPSYAKAFRARAQAYLAKGLSEEAQNDLVQAERLEAEAASNMS